jgi:hypothetical protein
MLREDMRLAALKLGIKTFREPNIIGTDDDLASRTAIHNVFRDSTCVYCLYHLRSNVRSKANTFGYTKKSTQEKRKILVQIEETLFWG